MPKVLGWSATCQNPVGSEYMILSKAEGKELRTRWFAMTTKERFDFVGHLVDVEKRVMDVQLPKTPLLLHLILPIFIWGEGC